MTFAGDPPECKAISASLRLLGEPQTVSAVEAESLAEMAKDPKRLPQVPFGFSNDYWNKFKSTTQDGDTLVKYAGGGLGGYLLLRGGCVVGMFNTTVFN